MSGQQKNSNDHPTVAAQSTALVPRARSAEEDWNEQQRPLSEQLPYNRELNALWIRLRADWSSLVIVPCEPDGSTVGIARALCEVGSRLSVHPIEFLEATGIDLESSSRLIARLGGSGRISGPAHEHSFVSSSWALPITRSIVALDSPLANPMAVPISLAADGIVLCVRRGRDRIASVRETIAALGHGRILCCVLLDEGAEASAGR
jgi:hypothetical protein